MSAMLGTMAYADPLVDVIASPADSVAGATTNYNITFRVQETNVLSVVGMVFPAGFDVSGATFIDIGWPGLVDPTGTISASGQVVKFECDGLFVSLPVPSYPLLWIEVGGIVNTVTPGDYIVTVATFLVYLTPVDGPTDSALFEIEPGPSITLSPDTGFATTITGDRFSPGATVTIKWDTSTMVTIPFEVMVEAGGTFVAMVTALSATSGDYVISADDGMVYAEAIFTVPDMTGPQGETGPQGDTGPAGLQGEQGPQGPIGPQGIQGEEGPRGETGPRGATGPTGKTGPQGPQGLNGTEGPRGPEGSIGPGGSTGPQGPRGLQGVAGDAGEDGAQGLMGPAGPQGDQGLPGEQGPAGSQGEQGPAGPQGEPAPSTVVLVGGTVAFSSIIAVVIFYMLKART